MVMIIMLIADIVMREKIGIAMLDLINDQGPVGTSHQTVIWDIKEDYSGAIRKDTVIIQAFMLAAELYMRYVDEDS